MAIPRNPVFEELQRTEHRKWGLVIYRCTYGNDEAWTSYLDRLDKHLRRILDIREENELLQLHQWKVIEDPQLDGASSGAIREHFRKWCASEEANKEQYNDLSNAPRTMLATSVRYQFPIFVDEKALTSLKDPSTVMYSADAGYFNILDAEWELPNPDTFDYEFHGEDPETYGPRDDGEITIEGCRANEVGWCKVAVSLFGMYVFSHLVRDLGFLNIYIRPGREKDIYEFNPSRDRLEMFNYS